MLAYIVRRLFIGVIMLLVMSMVTFVLFFSTGDPARRACGKNCSLAQIEQTKKSLGYDQPLATQWVDFIEGLAVGRQFPNDAELRERNPEQVVDCAAPCLGYSVVNVQTVNEEIKESFPVSLSLALVALILWVTGGVLLGVFAAVFKGSILDRGVVGISLVFYAFPTFFIGVFLLKFLAIKWGLTPVPAYTPIAEAGVFTWLNNLLLPALTLALVYMAGYVRITRAFVLESMSEDYVRTARAKGLPGRTVLMKHSVRAALTPLVTMVGLDFAGLVGGAIITETVFNFNGLGKLAVQSIETKDLPTMVGLVLLLGAFVILANIIVDVLYAVIDPRVRVG